MSETLTLDQPTYLESEIIRLFKNRPAVCILILGRRGTGKTDVSLLFAEILAKFNLIKYFASNIKVYESPFLMEHITNLEDLESWCRNNNGRKLFILDEAGKAMRRRTPMSKLNIELLDNLQILRKYKLSLNFIAPSPKYIDSASLGSDVLDVVFLKPYFNNQKVGIWYDQQEDYQQTYQNIPATSIKFDSYDVAPFVKNSPKAVPKFKDKDMEMLWSYVNGKSAKELGYHNMQISRICKRFIKESLEKASNV